MFDYNPEHKNLVAGTDEMPFFFNILRDTFYLEILPFVSFNTSAVL